jgi:hypothetical protein
VEPKKLATASYTLDFRLHHLLDQARQICQSLVSSRRWVVPLRQPGAANVGPNVSFSKWLRRGSRGARRVASPVSALTRIPIGCLSKKWKLSST